MNSPDNNNPNPNLGFLMRRACRLRRGVNRPTCQGRGRTRELFCIWESLHHQSKRFNARLRDELLNGEIFYSLKEAQIIIESWRRHYNTKRPHSALGYRPPAPESIIPLHKRIAMH